MTLPKKIVGSIALIALAVLCAHSYKAEAKATQYVPIYYFYSSPSSINYGDSTVIYWAAGNADWCAFWGTSADVGSGAQHVVAPSGAWRVYPTTNAQYWLSCVNQGKSNWGVSGVASTYVSVSPPCTSAPNICGMTTTGAMVGGVCTAHTPADSACPLPSPTVTAPNAATPLLQGAPASFTWSCPADSEAIGSGFETLGQHSGTVTVNPTETTNYTVTCVAAWGGRATSGVTFTVNQPQLSISATPDRVKKGNTATVSWSATNVDDNSCSVTSNAGTPTWTTSPQTVAISSQTVFSLHCTTPGGSVQKTATVNLVPSVIEF